MKALANREAYIVASVPLVQKRILSIPGLSRIIVSANLTWYSVFVPKCQPYDKYSFITSWISGGLCPKIIAKCPFQQSIYLLLSISVMYGPLAEFMKTGNVPIKDKPNVLILWEIPPGSTLSAFSHNSFDLGLFFWKLLISSLRYI